MTQNLQNYTDTNTFTKLYLQKGTCDYLITSREKEVLMLIAGGKTTKEIASILYISAPKKYDQKNECKRYFCFDTDL